MSISSALNSALTGITATSRQAEAVSNNVANATTAGYARRSVSLSALNLGGSGQGVRIIGIMRHSDIWLINDRRQSQALSAGATLQAEALARIEHIIGDTETPGSLVSLVQSFDTALLEAASRPESEARLTNAVEAAQALARGLNTASNNIQAERERADNVIASAVTRLNAALKQVGELNNLIASYSGSGRETAALSDQRQKVIDEIAALIPLKEIQREGNRIALVSAGGAVLLESSAVTLGFDAVHTIVPEMTIDSGALSGLTINGKAVITGGPSSLIKGGELAALFAIRDEVAVESQALLDAMARDLAERFNAPGLDPTLLPGTAGLFTDTGLLFDPLQEAGLAARIRLNAAVDPLLGGQVSRLRDGLAAVISGPLGNGSLLSAYSAALNASRPSASAALPGQRSLPGIAADILSAIASKRVTAEQEQSFTSTRYHALADLEARNGVNTDEEMQALLVIEKNYAANARVFQVVDEMIKTLLGL